MPLSLTFAAIDFDRIQSDRLRLNRKAKSKTPLWFTIFRILSLPLDIKNFEFSLWKMIMDNLCSMLLALIIYVYLPSKWVQCDVHDLGVSCREHGIEHWKLFFFQLHTDLCLLSDDKWHSIKLTAACRFSFVFKQTFETSSEIRPYRQPLVRYLATGCIEETSMVGDDVWIYTAFEIPLIILCITNGFS